MHSNEIARAASKHSDFSDTTDQTVDIYDDLNHVFHLSCLKEWLMINGKCPICNLEVTEEILIKDYIEKQCKED